jgi:hypothetical protein
MTGRQVVKTTVTVSGLVPGDPPMLAWHKRLQGMGGREKVHTQWVQVRDSDLFRRLQEQVHGGDVIEVTMVTDWASEGAATVLTDFSCVRIAVD